MTFAIDIIKLIALLIKWKRRRRRRKTGRCTKWETSLCSNFIFKRKCGAEKFLAFTHFQMNYMPIWPQFQMSIKSEIVHYFFNSQMCGLCWNCKRTCLMLLTNTQYSNLINASPFGVKTVFLFASSSRQPSKTHFPFKSFKMRSSSYSSRLMNVFFHFLSVH